LLKKEKFHYRYPELFGRQVLNPFNDSTSCVSFGIIKPLTDAVVNKKSGCHES
jgi:hypothetical protein